MSQFLGESVLYTVIVSVSRGIVSKEIFMRNRYDHVKVNYCPSEEFELTANSPGADIETHGRLILMTLR